MSSESEVIANAILALKNEQSFIKDYVYPVSIAAFSALMGGFIAYFSVKYQKYIDAQKAKLELANKWVTDIQGALETLAAIKRNYHSKLGDSPLQRTASINEIIVDAKKINLPISELSFLTPREDEQVGSEFIWRSLPRINSLASNYNMAITIWEKRNRLASVIIPALTQNPAHSPSIEHSFHSALSVVGAQNLYPYIDVTERLIRLTDDLIIEAYNFTSNFYHNAKYCIDLFRIKTYGGIVRYQYENQEAKDILNRCPPVDFPVLCQLFNEDPEDLQNRYRTGYDDVYYPPQEEEADPVAANIKKYRERQKLKEIHRRWW